jgi:hypothetical protein
LIIANYDRPVDVEGYVPTFGTQRYDTVNGVVAYNHPQTGKILHLVINQAIHIPHLDHHLLCPMQCHVNDVTVGETPKFLAPNPTDEMHALMITDHDDPTQAVHHPLALQVFTSLLHVQKPTRAEGESDRFPWYHLTSESLTWDPLTTLTAFINHPRPIGGIIMTNKKAMVKYLNRLLPSILCTETNITNPTTEANTTRTKLNKDGDVHLWHGIAMDEDVWEEYLTNSDTQE